MSRQITLAALARHLSDLDHGDRVICAVAGAPGSGKSTLAEALAAQLNKGQPGTAEVVPMDGFHYDDLYLVPAGLRPRKGAPHTFDVGGLRNVLARLRTRDEDAVAVPVFDRDMEIARAGARLIDRSVRIILAEGNYLLLDSPPWRDLSPLFDVTVMIDVDEQVLRARLTRRWTRYGLTDEQIEEKLEGNDLPNGRVVRETSAPADFVIRQNR
ncbi:nucleoside triphosphate hydrolase [Paracoccus tegillarcae]|uniref:Nucleoside/nucleotide kinase family protein n=1 Tax=Paracoccus tegillarcae TaxID=1529068 RepID=A0A2K9EH93_9RHOB|nr:nucleoside triphosphate hydrolase [Paracoccus tegillarcae]AUH34358.1 nucleoside/nucleotide kinase family protein [Paracoccus tegillarcae]